MKSVAVLVLAFLFATASLAQRRVGQSNIAVPVPADPHELVTGSVQTPAAEGRGADLELLQRALQNSRLHDSGMAPFRVDVTFSSAGSGTESGSGQMTEVWLSPRAWRWNATLGGVSLIRGSGPRGPYADSNSGVPTRIHMLRNAIFASMYDIAIGTQLRTATVSRNGKPATCMMTSGVVGPAKYPGRLWEELEYCFDEASNLLATSSFAPGSFTLYSYSKKGEFHGHTLPDHVTIFEAGRQVIDADVQISDAAGTDPNSLAPTAQMVPRGAVLDGPSRQPLPIPAPAGISKVSPIMVHASVVDGKVVETEVCAASDESLIPAAVEAVKQMAMPPGMQQQIYFSVKFVPASN